MENIKPDNCFNLIVIIIQTSDFISQTGILLNICFFLFIHFPRFSFSLEGICRNLRHVSIISSFTRFMFASSVESLFFSVEENVTQILSEKIFMERRFRFNVISGFVIYFRIFYAERTKKSIANTIRTTAFLPANHD